MVILSIKLDKNLDCQYLCNKIQQLINWHNKNDPITPDSILTITIKKITDSDVAPLRIEYKES